MKRRKENRAKRSARGGRMRQPGEGCGRQGERGLNYPSPRPPIDAARAAPRRGNGSADAPTSAWHAAEFAQNWESGEKTDKAPMFFSPLSQTLSPLISFPPPEPGLRCPRQARRPVHVFPRKTANSFKTSKLEPETAPG